MFEDELKPGRCFTDDQIERFVRNQADEHRGMSWPEICAKIADWANVQGQGRYFQEADYQFLRECLHARSGRQDVANDRRKAETGRVGQDETYKKKGVQKVRMVRQIGPFVQGIIGHLQEPEAAPASAVDSWAAIAPGRRVRGPARHDADERYARRLNSRKQADRRKMPASIS